jgi:hypothetical protein
MFQVSAMKSLLCILLLFGGAIASVPFNDEGMNYVTEV